MSALPDCGDSLCDFAETRTGMRTNGGCRCLVGDLQDVRRVARLAAAEVRRLRALPVIQTCRECAACDVGPVRPSSPGDKKVSRLSDRCKWRQGRETVAGAPPPDWCPLRVRR